MITISLFRNKEQKIVQFSVSGHAGFAQSGADIVCASVTTAAFTAVNGITDVAGIKALVEVRDGYLACKLPAEMSPKERDAADLLLESMVLSLANIEEQYGSYVKISQNRE